MADAAPRIEGFESDRPEESPEEIARLVLTAVSRKPLRERKAMNAAESDAGANRGAVFGPEEGDAYWWLGSLTINKVVGGGMTFVDHLVPPGYSPPLHIHLHQDEVFVITEGRFTMTCGEDTWQAEPGSLVFLPRGVPHRFVVSGDGPGRALIVTAPGGFAELVADIGQPADQLTLPGPDVPMPAPEQIEAASEAHGIQTVH